MSRRNYLTVDPISVSIFLTAFQTLSQPIAGLIFGILFWNIARIQKTINRIVKDKDILRKHPIINLELDEIELKKYLDKVIKELKKK
ncbi:MAG: hypothetical protein ACM3XP_07825 [Nitrososphaerales archaeon]